MSEVITIDGPVSSGKNSVGFMLAKKLGYQFVDTGMIYRAGAYYVFKNKIPLDDLAEIVRVFQSLGNLEIKLNDGGLRIIHQGQDITEQLYTQPVTELVPKVAAIKEVRGATKSIQRKLAEEKNTVMSGRDIGSEIFPNAQFKFYLTASPEVRAKRRYEQLKSSNLGISYQQVLNEIKYRDLQDSTREASPLRVPEGAITIDNSNLTIEQTVEEMLKACQKA